MKFQKWKKLKVEQPKQQRNLKKISIILFFICPTIMLKKKKKKKLPPRNANDKEKTVNTKQCASVKRKFSLPANERNQVLCV